MKPVFFITDILFFSLLAMIAGVLLYARGQEHLRAPWREITRRPLAMSALVILLVYTSIAVLDSMHFYPRLPGTDNYDSRVNSALDYLLQPLRDNTETSYSSPFATHALAREIIVQADGQEVRDYPRLQWGGGTSGRSS